MDKIYDMDDDFEEFGREEEKQKQLMKGIKKFEARTIYNTHHPTDDEFLRFSYDTDLSHLIDFGPYAEGKLTQLNRFSQPLKNMYRVESKTDVITPKATVPEEGQSSAPSGSQKDDRKRVGDSIVEFPQTAVGYVQVEFNDNTIVRGTGSMIGPNHVLTAAHNVYSRSKPNRKIVKIHFFPGLKDHSLSFKQVGVTRVILLEKYKAPVCKSPEEWDLSVLILQEPLGLTTGWFGLLVPEKFDAVVRQFDIHGYPADKHDLIQHCVSTKALKAAHKDLLEYENGACSGMNGGPICVQRAVSATSLEYYIVGVHLKQQQGSNSKVGVRLTKEKFDEISEIVSFFYLQDSLDDGFYASTMTQTNSANISFDFCKQSRTKQLNNAVHALRFNPQLTEVAVRSKTIDNLAIINDETLELLEQSANALRRLKQLKLEFYDADHVTDKGLKSLSKFLVVVSELTHLTILITNHQGRLSPVLMKEIFSHIGRMPNLTNLSVTLNNLKSCDDEPMKALSASIYASSQLESVKLHLQTLPEVTEIGFTSLISNLQSLENLKKLSVTLFGFRFADPIKKQIKTTFKNLPHLTVL